DAGLWGIAAGPADLWFAESSANKVGRITPRGTVIEYPVPTPAGEPFAVTADRSTVWFTERGASRVGVFDVPPVIATGADAGGVCADTHLPPGSGIEIVAGAGPGGGPHVKVFDAETGDVLESFFAYDAAFAGGVRVAAGLGVDIRPDIITAAGPGGGPHVK